MQRQRVHSLAKKESWGVHTYVERAPPVRDGRLLAPGLEPGLGGACRNLGLVLHHVFGLLCLHLRAAQLALLALGLQPKGRGAFKGYSRNQTRCRRTPSKAP